MAKRARIAKLDDLLNPWFRANIPLTSETRREAEQLFQKLRAADESGDTVQFVHLRTLLDGVLSAAETRYLWQKLRDGFRGKRKSKPPPPLTELEQEVLDIITSQPKGAGIKGPEIIRKLAGYGKGLAQGTLTRHIIPRLKKWYRVKNRPGVGYYRELA